MKSINEIAVKLAPGEDGATPWEPRGVWQPTEEDVAAYISKQGWPSIDDLSTEHLKSATEKDKLEAAQNAARQFVMALQEGAKGMGLVLLAGPVDGDLQRTGYGCGKTHLARAIHFANSRLQYVPQMPGEMWVHPRGKFYESRELMALFDADEFDQGYTFSRFGNLLTIDDVGREGTLKWERRDPELQLQEKRDRYYSVVNYCYEYRVSLAVTSNLAARELAGFLGGATWSRLLQMCPPQFRVNMTGLPDMRPVLGEQRADNWGF